MSQILRFESGAIPPKSFTVHAAHMYNLPPEDCFVKVIKSWRAQLLPAESIGGLTPPNSRESETLEVAGLGTQRTQPFGRGTGPHNKQEDDQAN